MTSAPSTTNRKTVLGLAIVAGLFAAGAYAAPAAHARTAHPSAPAVVNPLSPAYQHPYRHGVIPTRQVQAAMKRWELSHPSTQVSSNTLYYGGGISGVGVLSGQSKVYLVFYGNQWGTQTTDANGNMQFSNDTAGAAGAAQQMFKGIGTNGELWSAELTQWCDGAGVSSGASSCPSTGVNFIPYQQNILAGVWYDNSAASPATASAAQLAAEANSAAAHFGNTTSAANRYAYYVIMSPKGTNPDSYQGQYCAWHDYTSQTNGKMAYSNQPYNIDSGSGCGVGFVNSPGTLDGFTMTLGHEWHEMMSDQFPAGGWTASSGYENSDECAWISAGSTGGAANITFSTGTFAEQASWSNDTNSCAISHPIVNGGSGGNNPPSADFTFSISNLTANFTDSSSDSDGTIASHSWDFGDGSSSTATNPSHTYAAGGSYTVTETVTDDGGATGSKTSSVTVGDVGGTALQNGVAVSGLAATLNNQLNFKLVVPAGATGLSFVQSGGTGDSDMYVKFGAIPTTSSYDCRPYVAGNGETCAVDPAQAGTYYVMLNAYATFSGVSLVGSYTAPSGGGGGALSNGVPVLLPLVHVNKFSDEYTFDAPDGASSINISISGGTGNADLYVRRGAKPTINKYGCRPALAGNEETCTFNSKKAGTYHIRVLAKAKFTGVSLVATHTP
jgi:serine protease